MCTHGASEAALDELHVALGVASVRISIVYVPGAEPSSVTFAPRELRPFFVRCEFRYVQEDDGTERFWVVGGPALVEPPKRTGPVEVRPAHARALEANHFRYRHIAEALIQTDFERAALVRKAALAADRRRAAKSRRPWTRLERLDLALEFTTRQDEYEDGLMYDLAQTWGVGREAIYRQLKLAAADGQIPGGYPPRPRATQQTT